MFDIKNILKNMPELELDESKKKILLVYFLAIVVIFVAYFFFFLRPSLTKLFDILPKVRVLNLDIKAVHDDSRFEDKLTKKLDMLREKMGGYENKLSREKEIPKLLENLSKTARSSRVKILGIVPFDVSKTKQKGAVAGGGVYQEVPITISAYSGYHDLGIFINKLENGERFMRITDIEIKANRNNPKRHDIEFVVYAYTFKSES